jgi:ribosomal protein L17
MYLSYLDESGSPGDRNTPFFVLGGFSVFERQTHWIEKALEEIADRYQQRIGQYLELHAAPMRSGETVGKR